MQWVVTFSQPEVPFCNQFGLDVIATFVVIVVVEITPSLPWDRGTARTAIQVHVVNLIAIRLGERWHPISNQA